jgi:enoyl-CoA hydratase/carnithine racemase
MTSGDIRVSSQNGVAQIELARSATGNALTSSLVDELHESLAEIFRSKEHHSVVLRGDGRHFCTGFDLTDIDQLSDGDLLLRFVRIEQLLSTIWYAPIRTVAFGTGRITGAGADLFVACDVRIAAPSATFRFPGAGFGIVLGSRRLAARIGDDRARAWVSEGTEVDAVTAHASGLVTAICENADVASLPPITIDQSTLRQINRATRSDERDRDLAALVRSASNVGLRDRILLYVASVKGRKAR